MSPAIRKSIKFTVKPAMRGYWMRRYMAWLNQPATEVRETVWNHRVSKFVKAGVATAD